jgi:hypothetical protein
MLETRQRRQGKDANATRAKASTQQGQQRRRNASDKDNSTLLAMTPSRCGQNASTTQANASTAPALKANLATTLAQHWQQGQLDAGNDASARQQGHQCNAKKRHCCLGQTVKGQTAVGRRRVQQQRHRR